MKRIMMLVALGGLLAASSAWADTFGTYTCAPQVSFATYTSCTDYTDWLAAAGGSVDTETFTGSFSVASVVGMNGPAGMINMANQWQDALINGYHAFTDFGYTGGNFSAVGGWFDLRYASFGIGIQISAFLNPYNVNDTPTPVALLKYNPTDGGFQYGFFGFTSTSPIYAVRVGLPAGPGEEYYYLDNLSFSAAAPTAPIPEPATYALVGLGLLGMGFLRRRSR